MVPIIAIIAHRRLHESFYLVLFTYFHTLKKFQSLLCNTNSFICTQSNGFKYCYVTLTIQFNTSHLLVLS